MSDIFFESDLIFKYFILFFRLYQEDATMLPRHEDLNEKQARMPLLFVIVGILVTLMILGALLTAILAVRRQRAAKLNQIEIQSGSSSGEGKYVQFIIIIIRHYFDVSN